MTLEDLQYFETYSFSLNKRVLELVGLWPYQEPKRQFVLNCVVNFFFVTAFIMQMHEFCKQYLNLVSIISQLQFSVTTFCCFVCYNTGVYNTEIVIKLYDRIKLDIISMKNEWETAMLRKYSYRSNIYIRIVAFLACGYYVVLIFSSIFSMILLFNGTLNDTSAVLPLPFEQFLDTKLHYYGMLLYQFQIVFVVIAVAVATYTTFMALVHHSCLLLGIVVMKINRPFIGNSYDNRFLGFDAFNSEYNWLIDIVTSYISATNFVDLINLLTEKVYLVQVAGAVPILILTFLYLLDLYFSEYRNLVEIVQMIISIITVLFIVYINCSFGQMLIDHTTVVSKELRQLPFYSISVKTQKMLPLVIMGCTKPCGLMIGGMFVSSNEFFSGFMQTLVSYATVCYAMR